MPKEGPRLPEDSARPDIEVTSGVWLRTGREGDRFVDVRLSLQETGRVLQSFLEDFPAFTEIVYWDTLKGFGVTTETYGAGGYGVTKEFVTSAVSMHLLNATLQITRMRQKDREAPTVQEAFQLALEGKVKLTVEDQPSKKRFRLWQ